MGVWRKRSTTSVPGSLSSSYLIGSPPTGTSMTTFTSSGGRLPIGIASMRIRSRPELVPDAVERASPELFLRAGDQASSAPDIERVGALIVGERAHQRAAVAAA